MLLEKFWLGIDLAARMDNRTWKQLDDFFVQALKLGMWTGEGLFGCCKRCEMCMGWRLTTAMFCKPAWIDCDSPHAEF